MCSVVEYNGLINIDQCLLLFSAVYQKQWPGWCVLFALGVALWISWCEKTRPCLLDYSVVENSWLEQIRPAFLTVQTVS